jgi:hypothetical protein
MIDMSTSLTILRRAVVTPALVALTLAIAGPARADWMAPDPTLRDALLMVRLAARDTAGAGATAARLDTLGLALLRVGRFAEATDVLGRALAMAPADLAARAGLGRIALYRDDLAAAESLLAGPARDGDADAARDLFAVTLRAGRLAEAAALCDAAGQPGRADQLRRMAERGAYRITAGPDRGEVMFERLWPAPLVKVKLNGITVLMAIDTGADDLLLDDSAARARRVEVGAAQSTASWAGTRSAVRNAWVQRLEIAGFRIEGVPAGCLPLRRFSLEVNPQGERIAGVIGLGLLRRFVPTLDFGRQRLVLRRPGVAIEAETGTTRVPFELWGEGEITVWGSIAGGRRLAMALQTGIPACGVGAPQEVFEEFGIKPSAMSRAIKGAGSWMGGRPWVAVVVPTVNMDRLAADKVPGWMGAFDSAELWRLGVRRDAVLSHAFFRDRSVTIDWATHQLVIRDSH